MSPLLALLLQAAAAAPAPEPAWQSLGVHQGVEIAWDPASVRAESGRVRVRIPSGPGAAMVPRIRTRTRPLSARTLAVS